MIKIEYFRLLNIHEIKNKYEDKINLISLQDDYYLCMKIANTRKKNLYNLKYFY